ncbi:bacteriocin [Escherichia coli]|uniref:bacteriocin n=1 Tax=Escherichia coli TaxID=562 RepID=UPI000BE58105|nr:bacteriocin [Escherichia coli]ELJ0372364.1 bacteriocin [Escherichia coli]ELJ9860452.1 bacteriocin [Escherichia coli]
MGYGLLDIANQSRREALQGISDADRRREEIEASNKMMAAQQKAQHKQNIGTGLGTGAAVGAAVGGPVGAVAGAVIGGIAGSLF